MPVVTFIIVTVVIADNLDVRIALGSDDDGHPTPQSTQNTAEEERQPTPSWPCRAVALFMDHIVARQPQVAHQRSRIVVARQTS